MRSTRELRGAIVIDTDVFGSDLVPGSRLADRYAPIITGRPAFISFQTVMELRFGALRRQWGADSWIAATAIRLGVPLISDDGIFQNVPGLTLEAIGRA